MNPTTYLRWAARRPSAAEVYADCRELRRDERAEALAMLLELYGENWLRSVARQLQKGRSRHVPAAASLLAGAIEQHLEAAQ